MPSVYLIAPVFLCRGDDAAALDGPLKDGLDRHHRGKPFLYFWFFLLFLENLESIHHTCVLGSDPCGLRSKTTESQSVSANSASLRLIIVAE